MLFNSLEFAAFAAVVLLFYHVLDHRRQNTLLLVASYTFYAAWDWRFLFLLWGSTFVDFVAARAMHRSDDRIVRRRWLAASLGVNLGALGFFKYFGFFVDSASELLAGVGLGTPSFALQVILPVGISFYTFQSLSYSIDVYRKQREPVARFADFALFVAYFPQLVAGPIERASRLLPQIERARKVDRAGFASGLQLILLGYVKKVAIADSIAPLVDRAFTSPTEMSSPDLWIAVYLFALQIYCDFSGYTDIARGVSRLLGIELMRNFREPYLSRNVTEFWRRWHISLSQWLRDYLYIPLGGNRGGSRRTAINLMLTMLIGGLWHGASWTFVAWGGLHGIYLVVHRAVLGARRNEVQGVLEPTIAGWLRYALCAFGTFNLVCFAWIFFRADDFAIAWSVIEGLVGGDWQLDVGALRTLLFYGALIGMIDFPSWRADRELPWTPSTPAWARGLIYATAVVLISFVGSSEVVPFIYFQF